MNSRQRTARTTDTALLWFACFLVACLGYYLVFTRLQGAIDRQHDLAGDLSASARQQTELRAQLPDLQRAAHAIDASVEDLQLNADRPATVARFIRSASQIAAEERVKLVQIDEAHANPVTPATPTPRAAFAFETIPLDVTLRGSYRDLLATICALVRAPITMQMEIAAIERSGSAAGAVADEPLEARIHVVLERLPDGEPTASAAHPFSKDTTNHARSF